MATELQLGRAYRTHFVFCSVICTLCCTTVSITQYTLCILLSSIRTVLHHSFCNTVHTFNRVFFPSSQMTEIILETRRPQVADTRGSAVHTLIRIFKACTTFTQRFDLPCSGCNLRFVSASPSLVAGIMVTSATSSLATSVSP